MDILKETPDTFSTHVTHHYRENARYHPENLERIRGLANDGTGVWTQVCLALKPLRFSSRVHLMLTEFSKVFDVDLACYICRSVCILIGDPAGKWHLWKKFIGKRGKYFCSGKNFQSLQYFILC